MGTPFGVEYACLFMSYQEYLIDISYDDVKPDLNSRYIDDIFGISSIPKVKLDKYIDYVKNFHPNLEYTVTVSRTVNMLDTTLSIDGVGIKSTLFSKSTDKHTYLNYESSHPKACKDSIPYSQFLRIRRICSDDNDYKIVSNNYVQHFLNQNYPRNVVRKALSRVNVLTRDEVLYKTRNQTSSDRIVFPITFHPSNRTICQTIKRNFQTLTNDTEVSKYFSKPPILAYKKDKSLKDHLVKSSLKTGSVCGTESCGRTRCITCDHLNHGKRVVGPKGFVDVSGAFTCISEGVIYVIECKKCGILYVGETGRKLCERFLEHRRAVINKKENNEIAFHYNSHGHTVNDMTVCGILHCRDTITRKLKEQKFIAKLGCTLGSGLNIDFDFPELLDV